MKDFTFKTTVEDKDEVTVSVDRFAADNDACMDCAAAVVEQGLFFIGQKKKKKLNSSPVVVMTIVT